MPAFDYSDLLATAQDLIQRFGRQVTFVKLDASPADADKPWLGATAPRSSPDDTATVYAVNVPVSSLVGLGGLVAADDMLKDIDLAMIVEAQGDDLTTFQVLQDGGVDYRLKIVRTLKPGGTTMLFAVGACR